jgi:hypothetical protein
MNFVPAWSPFSVPQRGKSAYLQFDVVDLLVDEYAMAAQNQYPILSPSVSERTDSPVSDSSSDSDSTSDGSTSNYSDTELVEIQCPRPMMQLMLCQIWNKNTADNANACLRPRPPTPSPPPPTRLCLKYHQSHWPHFPRHSPEPTSERWTSNS